MNSLVINYDLNQDVEVLARQMLQEKQVDTSTVHRFGPGVYVREAHLPAGALVVGHIHKQPHMNMMLTGRLLMLQDDGSFQELVAPMCFTSSAGRKVAYILEDVVWQNIYATEERDVQKLEEQLLDVGEFIPSTSQQAGLYLIHKDAEVYDYHKFLEEVGMTEEEVRAIVEREDDLMDFPDGSYKVVVADSMIEGKGVFASSNISAGEVVGIARSDLKRTPLGRYTNHSNKCNTEAVFAPNGDIYFIAKRDIRGATGNILGEEITVDYRQVMLINKETVKCLQ